jgi:hypothetical protein
MIMPLIGLRETRLPNGITNVDAADIFNSLREPDLTKYIRDFDDFVNYLVTDWSTGGVGAGTTAVQAGLGGLIRLTTTAADNDNRWIQRNNPNFQLVSGKRLFFQARIPQVSEATQIDVAIGLQIAVAANNFLTPVNGLFFRKDDGDTILHLVNRAASVETVIDLLTNFATATEYRLQFFFDGVDTVWAAVNGTVLGKMTPAALPSVLMGPTYGIQDGDANARNMDIDQTLVLQER